jgi:hypothetical protein
MYVTEAIIDNRGYVFCEISFDSRRSEKYLPSKWHILYVPNNKSFGSRRNEECL